MPPAHDRDRAAVADHVERIRPEQRGIEQGVGAVGGEGTHGGDKLLAARDDDVSAEAAHECLIVGGGVGDHADAPLPGERDRI